LDLTSDQQTKVQPIVDAAKPQLAAIHQEAMQKAKGVIDNSLSQIRPLLTADQQKKLDAIQKAHQDMMNAHKELHDAMQQ
jgi:vacuolar-type H+-ATPase subunit E/Vma4